MATKYELMQFEITSEWLGSSVDLLLLFEIQVCKVRYFILACSYELPCVAVKPITV